MTQTHDVMQKNWMVHNNPHFFLFLKVFHRRKWLYIFTPLDHGKLQHDKALDEDYINTLQLFTRHTQTNSFAYHLIDLYSLKRFRQHT